MEAETELSDCSLLCVGYNEHSGVQGQGHKCNLTTLLIYIDVVNALCVLPVDVGL